MGRTLSELEIKEYGVNVVKEYLEEQGYQIIAVIPRADYFIMRVEKGRESNLIAINTVTYPANGDEIDIIDIHELKKYATENNLRLFYAGVGLIDIDTFSGALTDASAIIANFKGLQDII